MDDKQQIMDVYRRMYQAMIDKDTVTLNAVHAPEFVLTHMTGMRQPKAVYLRAIADGTLNYYSAEHEQMDIRVDGDQAQTHLAPAADLSLGQARRAVAVCRLTGKHLLRVHSL